MFRLADSPLKSSVWQTENFFLEARNRVDNNDKRCGCLKYRKNYVQNWWNVKGKKINSTQLKFI